MSQDAVAEIEKNIKLAKERVDLGDSLERLRNNRDFKKVIQEGFFCDEAVRLVQLKADPAFQTAERQESIVKQIDAIGAQNQYFQMIYQMAHLARKAIESDQETLEEVLAEDAE